MNVFEVHRKIIADYEKYIRSFITISDSEIEKEVDHELKRGKLWPEPLLQFNPAFSLAGKVADLARDKLVHKDVADIFKVYSLYHHQLEALKLGVNGKDFIVTSGTGSGKSLTYIGTVFSHLLNNPASKGVVAIVVYPLNALINSQTGEFNKYRNNYFDSTGKEFPITYGQYTGQEEQAKRVVMRENPPQILLTNYMMLEFLFTRLQERSIRDAIYENLKYLVFDELHTYRGRQGADVAMLIRRIRAKCQHEITCIGTSATMVSGGTLDDQRSQVADVATKLFGKTFEPSQVIMEKLASSLTTESNAPTKTELSAAILQGVTKSDDLSALTSHPVVRWLETNAALDTQNDVLIRRKPQPVGTLAKTLAEHSGEDAGDCLRAVEATLLWISQVNESIQKSGRRDTILPFRLHQFVSQTGSVYTTLDQGSDRFITLEPGIYKSDDSNQKPIFPNVFSRTSGHPFICVTHMGNRLLPREFMEKSIEEEQAADGYILVGDVWNPEEDLDSLPDAWFRINKSGRKPLSEKLEMFPQEIFFDELGNCSNSSPMKYRGWFMRAPLLFDPTMLAGHLRISPSVLRDFPVPIADVEIVTAIEHLAAARAAFQEWIEEIDDASNAIVRESTTSGSRNVILSSGQLARQRFRAATQVKELDYRIRTQYPHPLAYVWREVQVSGPDQYHRLRSIIKAAEAHTCVMAQLAIVRGRTTERNIAYLTSIADRLATRGGGTNFGDWFSVVKEVTESRVFRTIAPGTPLGELRRLADNTGWEEAIRRLMDLRNDDSHQRINPSCVPATLVKEAEHLLEKIFHATEFLTDYQLLQITETKFNSIRRINSYRYRDLSGDNPLAPKYDAQTDQTDLEADSLYLRDRENKLHLLRPMLTYLECPECHQMSTFFLDTFNSSEPSQAGIKSIERNSVRYEPIVDDFKHVGLLR